MNWSVYTYLIVILLFITALLPIIRELFVRLSPKKEETTRGRLLSRDGSLISGNKRHDAGRSLWEMPMFLSVGKKRPSDGTIQDLCKNIEETRQLIQKEREK